MNANAEHLSADHYTIISSDGGEPFRFGEVGGQFKIGGASTGERFAVAQLPDIPPGVLAAPLHRHTNEDEYTYVLDGPLRAVVGDEVLTVDSGSWLVKPRGHWHTFWNPGDTPCHVIEIVSPAGFEDYFQEVAAAGDDLEQLAEINETYGIDMDFDSIPTLCERFNLAFPEIGS